MSKESMVCVQKDEWVACTVDLTDQGVLKSMLQEVLSAAIAKTPNVTPSLLESVPEFVDAIIGAAGACNQPAEMTSLAHSLIENEPTPAQCRILIKAVEYYRYEVSCCPGVDVKGGKFRTHSQWRDIEIKMGKIWARIVDAVGHEPGYWEELEQKASNDDWMRRLKAGEVSGSAPPRSAGGPRG